MLPELSSRCLFQNDSRTVHNQPGQMHPHNSRVISKCIVREIVLDNKARPMEKQYGAAVYPEHSAMRITKVFCPVDVLCRNIVSR